MKNIFFFLSFLFLYTATYGQDKKADLSLEDAVLAYYKGLYPSSLSGLSWTSDNQYVFQNSDENISENGYIILDPNKAYDSKKRKVITLEKLADLCEGPVPLSNLPWEKSISGNTISFSHLNTYYKIDLKKK